MYKKSVMIARKHGLHARPAVLFTQKAAKFQSTVTVAKDGRSVDAKSIIKVLSLGAATGAMIEIAAEGADEQEAVDALAVFLESGLEE